MQNPNIGQFLNPYQQYVTNEIGRQGQIAQNQVAASAMMQGAFGGGRQGVQQAELQRQNFTSYGSSTSTRFSNCIRCSTNSKTTTTCRWTNVRSIRCTTTSNESLADINAQMQAGAVQRGIGQRALDAQRQTELQRAYEPYQRVEFMKGIMTNLPTTQSSITATTAPGSNPLAQAAGAGLGAYAAYNMMQPR